MATAAFLIVIRAVAHRAIRHPSSAPSLRRVLFFISHAPLLSPHALSDNCMNAVPHPYTRGSHEEEDAHLGRASASISNAGTALDFIIRAFVFSANGRATR